MRLDKICHKCRTNRVWIYDILLSIWLNFLNTKLLKTPMVLGDMHPTYIYASFTESVHCLAFLNITCCDKQHTDKTNCHSSQTWGINSKRICLFTMVLLIKILHYLGWLGIWREMFPDLCTGMQQVLCI